MQIPDDDTYFHFLHGAQLALDKREPHFRQWPLSAGMEATMTVAYISLSRGDQSWAMQLSKVREYAKHQGWQIGEIYEDLNGAAPRRRPALNRLIADARARKIRCVLVWGVEM